MALTISSKVNGASRVVQLNKGLKCRELRITVGAQADYVVGQGFVLTPAMLGMRQIWGVDPYSLRASTNVLRAFLLIWDFNTSGIRAGETTVTGILDEIETTDIAIGDIVHAIAWGV